MTHLRNFVLSLFLSLCGFAALAVADNYGTRQVFTMTNAAGGNAILIFNHHPQQGLVGAGSVATGGDGTGAGLGNQGGVILSKHHRWLYAVNAGSDSVSVFRVRKGGLTLIDTIPSDGSQPVSLTRHDNLLYVLNAGSDSIAGFTVNGDGTLSPLAGSVQGLSGGGPVSLGGTVSLDYTRADWNLGGRVRADSHQNRVEAWRHPVLRQLHDFRRDLFPDFRRDAGTALITQCAAGGLGAAVVLER